MRVAYVQSIGGASGDMLLGALVDLGTPLDLLERELAKLGVSGYDLTVGAGVRREVRGVKVDVSVSNSVRYSPGALREAVVRSDLSGSVKDASLRVLEALWRAESRVHGEPADAIELEELGGVDTLVDVVGVAAARGPLAGFVLGRIPGVKIRESDV